MFGFSFKKRPAAPVVPAQAPPLPQARFATLRMSMMGRKGSGCLPENQDRVLERRFVLDASEVLLIAVADGVSRCPAGGAIANYLISEHLASDPLFDHPRRGNAKQWSRRLPPLLRRYLRQLHGHFYKEFEGNPAMLDSACTLSVVVLEHASAHCMWVGDSPIFLARMDNGCYVTRQLSVPDLWGRLLIDCFGAHAPFEIKYARAELQVNDLIAVASDGVAKDPETFSAMLNDFGPSPKLLKGVESNALSSSYYDDASLVLAHRIG
jgi:serine/threonine protein phosphatase PrpC